MENKEINIKGYISEQELSNDLKEKLKPLDDLSAEKIKVKDITNVFTNDNVEDALFECANKINKLEKNVDDAKNKAEQAFQEADNGKKLIASAVGSPLSANDEFSTMSTKIQTMKNNFVENLNTKGQSIDKNQNLYDLISNIKNINTGKRFAKGTIKQEISASHHDSSFITINNLNFKPECVFVGYYKQELSNTIHPYDTSKTYIGCYPRFGNRLIYYNNDHYSWIFDITHDLCYISLLDNGFRLYVKTSGSPSIYAIKDIDWIAIE